MTSESTRAFAWTRLASLLSILPLGVWTANHLYDNLSAFFGKEFQARLLEGEFLGDLVVDDPRRLDLPDGRRIARLRADLARREGRHYSQRVRRIPSPPLPGCFPRKR